MNTENLVTVEYSRDPAWLCEALSKDETRPGMRGFLAEKEGSMTRLAAADGRRMHIMETSLYADIPAGLWVPQFGKKRGAPVFLTRLDGGFPDWERVMPDPRFMLRLFTLRGWDKDNTAMLYPLYRAGIRISPDYIKPLNGMAGEWDVYAGPENYGKGAVIFNLHGMRDGEMRKAVIMPLQNEDYPARALLIEKYGKALVKSVKAGYDESEELFTAAAETDEKEQTDAVRMEMLAVIISEAEAMRGEKTKPDEERGEAREAEAPDEEAGEETEPEEERGETEAEEDGEDDGIADLVTALLEEADEEEGAGMAAADDAGYADDEGEEEEEKEEPEAASLSAGYPAYLAAAIAGAIEEAA